LLNSLIANVAKFSWGLVLFNIISKLQNGKVKQYLFVGVLNTVVGYAIGVTFLYIFANILITPVIGILSTVLAIISNYVLFKTIVFKTKSGWQSELIRFLKVYLVSTVFGVSVLTICMDYLSISIPISQGLSMVAGVGVSAVGNFYFTFRN
jgi:putative flippase GtrA